MDERIMKCHARLKIITLSLKVQNNDPMTAYYQDVGERNIHSSLIHWNYLQQLVG